MLNPVLFRCTDRRSQLKSSFCDSENDRAMANEEQEISVEQMEDEDEEQMDQTSTSHTPTPTPHIPIPAPFPVIVSVTSLRANGSGGDSDSDHHSSSSRQSPSHPFPVPDINTQRMLANRLQVRQTLSEPGLKAKLQRQKHGQHRLSPIPRRHELGKTLSVGASLDAATGSVVWRVGEHSSSNPHSPTSTMESSHSRTNTPEGSPTPIITSTPSQTLPTITAAAAAAAAAAARLGSLQSGPWLLPGSSPGLVPSQEQLESLHKQQLEVLALIEQQKHAAHAGSTSTTELFQFPFALWPISGQAATQIQLPVSTTSSSATPSPTPSNSSTDSGISGLSAITTAIPGDTLSLGQQRRPLSESVSAPGFQTPITDTQYEAIVRQFQLQHQHILVQQQHLYQHYLEQQQRLMQQAMLERKHFEEQQRQLASMHLRQQQQLQKQQQLLRQMQEGQLLQLQRQQQILLFQTMGMQQQQQQAAQIAQAAAKQAPLRRMSGKDAILLSYSGKPGLVATTSASTQDSSDSMLSVDHANRSPNLTRKASLTPTNSLDSTASNNGRTSPNVGAPSPSSGQEMPQQGGTGLVYDTMMLKHICNCGGSHPEHPGRLQSIWARLHETRVVLNCRRLRARKASLAELQAIHSENHVRLYGRPSQRRPGQDKKDSSRAFIQLSCGGVGVDQDTYWNDVHTSNASRMAVGSVVELADKVASGEVKNGFAFVRPPGHHALPNQAMAFCYFNNIAVAAKAMISKNKRVLVVDWDIHHGNGTQQIFYDNPAVLYISIHRYDNGTFFPGTGRPEEIGSGAGLGFNVNIAFSGTQNFQGISASNCGDAEYLAAFRTVVIPIAREFNPDIMLVSAGFNATEGHPPTLGGYSVTPKCFAVLTRMLMNVGCGKVAMALEGGYELMSLCASAEACMRALLGHELSQLDSTATERPPQPAALASIKKTIAYHKPYWSSLSRSAALLHMSHTEAEKREVEEADTVTALASLSVAGDVRQRQMGTAV